MCFTLRVREASWKGKSTRDAPGGSGAIQYLGVLSDCLLCILQSNQALQEQTQCCSCWQKGGCTNAGAKINLLEQIRVDKKVPFLIFTEWNFLTCVWPIFTKSANNSSADSNSRCVIAVSLLLHSLWCLGLIGYDLGVLGRAGTLMC